MDYFNVLNGFLNHCSISGYESEFTNHLKTYFDEYCEEIEIDNLFNLKGKIYGDSDKKIMICAHIDEIGFLVKSIEKYGYIKITNVGGIDSKILLGQEVLIHGKDKKIHGIIGAKPPHLQTEDESKKFTSINDLYVDTGYYKTPLEDMISIGNPVSLTSEVIKLNHSKLTSKSLDNKCGVLCQLGIMEEITNYNIANNIVFLANTQEETHQIGIRTASYTELPNLAIVIDTTFGDSNEVSKDETYTLGRGPVITIGPNLHPKATQALIEVAKNNNFQYQIEIETGNTGTDAWHTQISRSGIPTILISVPIKYMHTCIETVDINDLKKTIQLISRFIYETKKLEDIVCI